MQEGIRGIACSLYNNKIEEVLHCLADEEYEYFVAWLSMIKKKNSVLPEPIKGFYASATEVKEFARNSIWELVLHVYPVGSSKQIIETFDDFIQSSCICCLIFYDCGLLDIYVKDPRLRERIYNLLFKLQAEDLEYIFDRTDARTRLFV